MFALAAAFVVLSATSVIGNLRGADATPIEVALIAVWVACAIDHVVCLVLAEPRRRWFVRHLHELAIVLLPFLRPLRLLTFADAIWWAFVTITTVGYGDFSPVTASGRLIAVGLMIAGIALIGSVTATFASWFVEQIARARSQDAEASKPWGAGSDSRMSQVPPAPSGLRPGDAARLAASRLEQEPPMPTSPRTHRAIVAIIAASAAALLAACASAAPSLALGESYEAPAGDGVQMAFAIDDVRQGTAADLAAMGMTVDLEEAQSAYFVTYSVALVSGDIADMDSAVLGEVDEWVVDGPGAYREVVALGAQYDCTADGTATAGVGPDAPLVSCIAFIGPTDAPPTSVEVTSLEQRWTIG